MNPPLSAATNAGIDVFPARVLVLMGVSGSGKTLVGQEVARRWEASFEDADHWHAPEAVAKMSAKIPLTDEDRAPWLARLRRDVIEATPPGRRMVLACSALKKRYRDLLRGGDRDVLFVYLEGSLSLIAERLAGRSGHYMPPDLLASQMATLEVPGPREAITVSIDQPPDAVADAVMAAIHGKP
ncbi:MAG: gluconokinase [Verrucomicrobiaceae bacterium]|nr:MAG: gluconokinase [Verrucomicrobiaceae bacterium]